MITPPSYLTASDLISLSLLMFQALKQLPCEVHDINIQRLIKADIYKITSQSLNKAMEIAKDIRNKRLYSNANGYYGRLFEIGKQFDQSVKYTRIAIAHAQEADLPELSYLWQWQLARVFNKRGRIEEAVKSYQTATSIISPRSITESCGILKEFYMGYKDRKEVFSQKIKPLFLELAKIKMDEALKSEDQNDLHIVRNTIERVKSSELQNFYQDECLPVISNSDNLHYTAIDEYTAVIYPIFFPENLTYMLIFQDSIQMLTTTVNVNKINHLVKTLNQDILESSDYSDITDVYKKSI
ncbi:MAG: hypothetical protein OMM_04526 [Candidatus Magnetoglobus multicellularis str. Araruama]|uniref:TPR repeat-containing protein n=1 Tax=Candidatus Magnetoglobus multicellularis str. Araruama TaxID=890399 RepID=A0A1V1P141_9BACT|nr:MAG: hypothetical protein OMM_04526 [Candidatus Magnetoglobus multicellularis str. Araruama]